jgi:methylenetetrahydrofolate dehydrogenase (NADP+)/methenyltetrahydrofolate cyclohydrolase
VAIAGRAAVSARIIDGNAVARHVRQGLVTRVARLKANGIVPGLAVVLVGDNAASEIYVRRKVRACEEVGLHSEVVRFPGDATQQELVAQLAKLNADPLIHGIIVQLPLPKAFDLRAVLEAVSLEKDVDGFHLYNVGGLVLGDDRTVFPPCTPYGVQLLLEHEGIPIEGRNVVVVGASNIVGKPMAMMLLRKEATVSICHVKTRDLAQYTILADILVVAAGKPGLIRAEMVRTGAVVIDVGINRLPDGRLVGDVDFDTVKEKASYITPVPGGVGPMTVTMLIWNTVEAAERTLQRSERRAQA